MPRLFISHSSKDNVPALAFKQWLGANGWPGDDVFLDLQDIGAGELWKDALRKAKLRCEAIILLASPEALDSKECLAELRTAEDYGKEIIVVLLHDLTFADPRLESYRDRQIVDLSTVPQIHVEHVDFRGNRHDVHFNEGALLKIRDYLFRRGITPDSFPWPPENRQDADPFPGLSAFTEDDAGIFFGRETDILIGLDELRLLRRNRSPRILAIQAASGAGKSSFLRAGLWPRLCRDPDYAPLGIVRPAGGILTGPEGFGRKIAARMSRPAAPINPGDVFSRLFAADASAGFAELMIKAAAQANEERRIASPDAPPPALVIGIDQAEELLGSEDTVESRRFVDLLAGVINNPPPGVEPLLLLTVRSDNIERLLQLFAQHGLEMPKILMLLPVPQTSFRDVIRKPIEVASRRGQQITMTSALIDRLVEDAIGADALPLLAFTLSYLYQSFAAGGSITLDQYKAIGGIAGSIDKAIKQALARPTDAPAIPVAADDQLACLRVTFIPWLASIDLQSNQPKRRIARLDEFVGSTRAMLDRLVKARLVMVDRRDGADVVEIAHESLLRQWGPLVTWLRAELDDLKIIESIERAASEWVRNKYQDSWLDHRAERLRAAARVAARKDFRNRLNKDSLSYLEACGQHEAIELREKSAGRAREWQRKIAQALVGGLAAVLFAGFLAWKFQQSLQNEIYRLRSVTILPAEQEHGLAQQDAFHECADCPEMVVVPGGSYKMGSPDPLRNKTEYPQHDVTIGQAFAVSRTEVTFDQWDACAKHGGCSTQIGAGGWDRGEQPVINITWRDAKDYVEWLSNITGKRYRLLSEAEWEYAAGAGKPTLYFFGNNDAMLDRFSWYAANAESKPHLVGRKNANPFGLKDMYGNVSEWVEDCNHDDYSGAPNDGSAWLSGDCRHRVIRGGDWQSRASSLRSAFRDWLAYDQAKDTTGLRVARTIRP